MTAIVDLLAPAIACLLGLAAWRLSRLLGATGNPFVLVPLYGTVALGSLLFLFDLTGLAPSVPAILVVTAAALLLTMRRSRGAEPTATATSVWALVAAVAAAGRAAALFGRGAIGWDFRYLWGLKAKTFALTGATLASWSAWPPNAWHHLDYPPLWTDILAFGIRLGGAPDRVASAWGALLFLALVAACWENCRGLSRPIQLTAAAVAVAAPVVLQRWNSGNADLAIAFLAAVAVGSLHRATRRSQPDRAALLTLSVAIVGLCLTKNEGAALAMGCVVGVAVTASRRSLAIAAATFAVPLICWHLFLAQHGIPVEPRNMSPSAWMAAAKQTAWWLQGHVLSVSSLCMLAWLLALAALARRASIGAFVALAVWCLAVGAAYATTVEGVVWQLGTSFDRVIAAPLPGVVALALAASSRTASNVHRDPVRPPTA
ncbi:MAG: hypothetical protein PHQ91_11255 [Thermoanaerobaculaceae bacterium]|nr:hypothetical protein [Thermoanaerobaculaceae bacterium]TAM49809.1 MAG: hypothetical protein EPN53_08125 [Acidobacteriota bacterium]